VYRTRDKLQGIRQLKDVVQYSMYTQTRDLVAGQTRTPITLKLIHTYNEHYPLQKHVHLLVGYPHCTEKRKCVLHAIGVVLLISILYHGSKIGIHLPNELFF
jgi:hypothetical protein